MPRTSRSCCRSIETFAKVLAARPANEGAPFTGLKPAGLDVGPVIPIAEKAIESGSPAALDDALVTAVRHELADRFHHLEHLRAGADSGLDGARAYVTATLGLQVWAHGVYQATKAQAHAATHTHD